MANGMLLPAAVVLMALAIAVLYRPKNLLEELIAPELKLSRSL